MSKSGRFTREVTLETGADAIELCIQQDCVGDVGAIVWDSALSCTAYLAKQSRLHPCIYNDKTVVELGAGTGICGLAMAALGASVTITDLPEQMALIEENMATNKSRATARALDWSNDEHRQSIEHVIGIPIDYLLMVDCIYYSNSLQPLIDTLMSLCHESTKIICFYELRDIGQPKVAQEKFFELIKPHFSSTKIDDSQINEEFICDDIVPLILQRNVAI